MSIDTMGKRIAELRKTKGVKQELLASYVGVSTQAVSKWENGGVPDTELLPKIADFFSVSIDSLFGRSIIEYGELSEAVTMKIVDTPTEERIKSVFTICWDLERALFGKIFGGLPDDSTYEEYENSIPINEQRYSRFLTDNGITLMGIANKLKYFCIIPEIESNINALFDNVDYTSFFKLLSDRELFDVLLFLNKRDTDKAFTDNLLVKNFGFSSERAIEIISLFEKYNLVYKTEIELDDEIKTFCNFKPTPSFVALLIFAREMIKPPTNYLYYNASRNKPYLY